jgi:blocked-early-in-transport protein 1
LSADAGFSAYPGANGDSGRGSGDGGFRSATPNKKGQYSNAVLDELESQNDEQIGIMSGKVRMLKDVSLLLVDDGYCGGRGADYSAVS